MAFYRVTCAVALLTLIIKGEFTLHTPEPIFITLAGA